MSELVGVELKLRRADQHLASIKDVVREVQAFCRAAVRSEEAEPGITRLFLSEDLPPVPPELSPLLGDFLHNVRSALDHLAAAAVLASGNDVTGRTCFPIFHEPNPKGVKIDGGVTPEFQRLFETMQPYHPDSKTRALPLRWLHDLNNYDKHRTLVVLATANRGSSWYAGDLVSVGDPIREDWTVGPGSELYRLRMEPGASPASVRFGVMVDIAEPIGPRLHTHAEYALAPIDNVCDRILGVVRSTVVPAFRPLLRGR